MKNTKQPFKASHKLWPLLLALLFPLLSVAAESSDAKAIPLDQLGAMAGQQYQGDALGIAATTEGARLRCGFQKLEGRITREGLWLESTEPGGGKLRVVAVGVDREVLECGSPLSQSRTLSRWTMRLAGLNETDLPRTGTVMVTDNLVRFTRPGLIEEYSVSVDGVRQDFIIESRPLIAQPSTLNPSPGELRVELELSGARAETMPGGVRLMLDGAQRALAYTRLRVTDATGRELPARLEVVSGPDVAATRQSAAVVNPEDGGIPAAASTCNLQPATFNRETLAILVADADATYPLRIDPTFSDADWVSLNPGFPGADGPIRAMAVDENGSLYVCGGFTFIGTVRANGVAKWDGNTWSALGSGLGHSLLGPLALALSGTNLYVGGGFEFAGGVRVNGIAKWDGAEWSSLGDGIGDFNNSSGGIKNVSALMVIEGNLFAGGIFQMIGGTPASNIAKWDGSAWSALGSGTGSSVKALAKIDSTLYAGGSFTTAGGAAAQHIAKWNGTNWSALGSGVNAEVRALATSGSILYAGGTFTTAGGVTANYIAKWNGSAWSSISSGMGGDVSLYRSAYLSAVVVSGTNIYAGGTLNTMGALKGGAIIKWNGSAWVDLGLGGAAGGSISALAANGANLYAGGSFTSLGGVAANNVARWNGSAWAPLGAGIKNGFYGPMMKGMLGCRNWRSAGTTSTLADILPMLAE